MIDETLFSEDHRATYCPEDNKLRLYVGRVPRDQYLKLRAEGWTALPKQRELGQGDFAATWTPERRNTALAYAGIIEDEDAGPDERAADRAERFGGYRDKRTNEATNKADVYESTPSAHGYQSQARAERAAARHDRIGAQAVDIWSKAEYWTRRTAGVIAHALYKSTPGVRMGRIKELEALIRGREKARAEYQQKYEQWQHIAKLADVEKQNKLAAAMAYIEHGDYTHPRTGRKTYLYAHCKEESEENPDPLNGAELAALWLANNEPLGVEGDWLTHYRMRLAYENQMLEAQGGRAAFVEMIPGGFIGSKQIQKVNKSPATGRVVSVALKYRTHGRDRWGNEDANAPEFRNEVVNVERLAANAYRAPTDEELAVFNAEQKASKAKAKKERAATAIPLVNPTDADAERLQTIWNDEKKASLETDWQREKFEPATVCRIPQRVYSHYSKGSYAKAETKNVCALGVVDPGQYFHSYEKQARDAKERGPALCQVRTTPGEYNKAQPLRVIVLTDKPQKPLPAAVWEKYQPKTAEAWELA